MMPAGACSASVMLRAPVYVDRAWQTAYSMKVTSDHAEMRDRPARWTDPQGAPRWLSKRDHSQGLEGRVIDSLEGESFPG